MSILKLITLEGSVGSRRVCLRGCEGPRFSSRHPGQVVSGTDILAGRQRYGTPPRQSVDRLDSSSQEGARRLGIGTLN